MKFSLIVCTYMRPKAVLTLLESVEKQELYPNEIIIVDGSTNNETKEVFKRRNFRNLQYFLVNVETRGLTKQRNFGINRVANDVNIICFLDDDIVLTKSYFKVLLETYKKYPNIGGVGGYILNEVSWKLLRKGEKAKFTEYEIDGWVCSLSSRNIIRKKMGLLSNLQPCIMPEFSNGFSVSNLPPSDEVYNVEYFMGGVSSFKKEVVDTIKFSEYFEGYGLYEDLEYCLRVSKKYKLLVNTGAKLYHYHEEGGRPNRYTYGKMVIRNGWYVWRTKYNHPSIKARFKWNAIALLLTIIRFTNVVNTSKRKEAFTEAIGRTVGWFSLLISKPR